MSEEAAKPGPVYREAALALINALDLSKGTFEVSRADALLDVAAYFSKYLFVWDRDLEKSILSSESVGLHKQDDLRRMVLSEAVYQLNTAPWLSIYHHEKSSECLLHAAVADLYDAGLLCRKFREDIFLLTSVPDEERSIPVIQLTESNVFAASNRSSAVKDAQAELYELALRRFQSRRDMLQDLGYGAPQVGPHNMRKVLNEIEQGSIVKISVYSGRTIFGADEWLKRLGNPGDSVEYRILALGVTVHSTLMEGAQLSSYRRNVLEGILLLRDKMSKMDRRARRKLTVRLCGHSLDDAYFRGFMVENAPTSARDAKGLEFPWKRNRPGSIRRCQATCWRFKEERGTYGEIAIFGSETNLAELTRSYFDTVFDKAIPLNFWSAVTYPWRKLGLSGWVNIGIAGFIFWMLMNRPSTVETGEYIQFFAAVALTVKEVWILGVNTLQMRPFDRYEFLKFLPSSFIRKTLDGDSKIGLKLFPDIVRRSV